MPAGLQLLVWSQPGSRRVFLSSLYGLQQGSSSPEVMMASFLDGIWKEQEILWLSSEGWLYYWDTTNKGWCRPGIPRLALALSLLFLPLWSLFPTSSLILSLLREGLQYLGLIRKHIYLQSRKKKKPKINRSLSVCWKSLTATCAMIQPPQTPQQLFCINHNSHTADCSLPKPLMKLPGSLWQRFSLGPHTVLILTQSSSLHPSSPAQPKMIFER